MLKLKDDFKLNITQGIIVLDKVWVDSNVLYLRDADVLYKYVNNEWFVKTNLTNDEFIPLGVGALPTYLIENADNVNTENIDAFVSLFAQCEEVAV